MNVQQITVETEEEGVRLDRWFRRRFPDLTHMRLEKLLRTGQVRVDGARAKSSARLVAGQVVRIPPLGEAPERPHFEKPKQAASTDDAQMLRDAVLYEDEDVLVLNKPSGLATQGGTGTKRHLDGMLDVFARKGERPKLVHRLDRDTSGVLVLARRTSIAAALTEAFRDRNVRKIYWALVIGHPPAGHGRIDLALGKRGTRGSEKVVPDPRGLQASTRFRVIQRKGEIAWLALEPESGRTHQLRVHCAALDMPILGDGKYGGRKVFVDGAGEGMHLHSRFISMIHPTGGRIEAQAPLPAHMLQSFKKFGFDPDKE